MSCLLGACLLAASPAGAAGNPDRGRQIYHEGTSAGGGMIMAIVGDEAVSLPASALPCVGCHGRDGLGRPEGGVTPPDIRWRELVKKYGHVHEDGRRHPPYDEAGFDRVMRMGLDPAGNRLDRAMPLYEMSAGDMADLVAYMKVLEAEHDPGVGPDRVRVATLLPGDGPRAPLGQAMAGVMAAYFDQVNQAGGVFGRRVELVTIPRADSPDESLENVAGFLAAGDLFCLVGGYTVGLDDEILSILRPDGVPLIGPFTLDPGDEVADAAAFYLYPGFEEQVRVLADRAGAELEGDRAVFLVGPGGARTERLVAAAGDQLRTRWKDRSEAVSYQDGGFDPAAVVPAIAAEDALIFLGPQPDLDRLLGALAEAGKAPRVYLMSSFLARPLIGAPPAFNERLVIAYPTHTNDVSPRGRAEYQALARTHNLAPDHIQAQVAALAAARLFVEGMRKAGRDLTRSGLVEALESLYAYDTGFTPPLTFGPNRRVGARGAHLVVVDLAAGTYVPVPDGWQEIR
jgi:ABC-type branched-subunit amino acid transport system substrate-binding protein